LRDRLNGLCAIRRIIGRTMLLGFEWVFVRHMRNLAGVQPDVNM
jgi:hypothetical protein